MTWIVGVAVRSDFAGLPDFDMGGDIRRSASLASFSARCLARADRSPSAWACIRQQIRFTSQGLFPVRVSSPKSSAYFPRSSFTVIRCKAATSCPMFRNRPLASCQKISKTVNRGGH